MKGNLVAAARQYNLGDMHKRKSITCKEIKDYTELGKITYSTTSKKGNFQEISFNDGNKLYTIVDMNDNKEVDAEDLIYIQDTRKFRPTPMGKQKQQKISVFLEKQFGKLKLKDYSKK